MRCDALTHSPRIIIVFFFPYCCCWSLGLKSIFRSTHTTTTTTTKNLVQLCVYRWSSSMYYARGSKCAHYACCSYASKWKRNETVFFSALSFCCCFLWFTFDSFVNSLHNMISMMNEKKRKNENLCSRPLYTSATPRTTTNVRKVQ